MKLRLPLLSVLLLGRAIAGTVPTGGEFLGRFQACPTTVTCPPDARGLMLEVLTAPPAQAVSSYGLTAWLISGAGGQPLPMGSDFLYWTSSVGFGPFGVFGYHGLTQGFPMPADGSYADGAGTFSVLFRNTGAPFDFLWAAPLSVTANLDFGSARYSVNTVDVNDVQLSEPGTALYWMAGLLALGGIRRAGHWNVPPAAGT